MSSLDNLEMIASAGLVDFQGRSVKIGVDSELKVHVGDQLLALGLPVGFILANLLDNIDVPILNKGYDLSLSNWYYDLRRSIPSLPKSPIESETGINDVQKANAIRTLEKGRTFSPRDNLFRIGFGSRVGSFLFLCSDLTDVNFGAELIAKNRRDSGAKFEQADADVKYFSNEFYRRVKVAARFVDPKETKKFVKAREVQLQRVSSVVERVWSDRPSEQTIRAAAVVANICKANYAKVTTYSQMVVDRYILTNSSSAGESFGVNEIILWLRDSGISASDKDVRSILETCHRSGLLTRESVEIDKFGNTATRYRVK